MNTNVQTVPQRHHSGKWQKYLTALAMLVLLMGLNIENAVGQNPVNPGFEATINAGTDWTTTGAQSTTNARTGTYSLAHTTSTTGSNVAHTNASIISVPASNYAHVIGWAVGNNPAARASCGGTLGGTTASTTIATIGTTLTRLVYTSAQNGVSAQNFTCRINTRSLTGSTTVYWDDVVMYSSSLPTPDVTDPTTPNSFTNGTINASSVSFSWMNGIDGGGTGVQNTIILRTTNTSATTPNMNDQGQYSTSGGTNGPNMVGTDWTILSVSVGSGTNSYTDNTVNSNTSYKYALIHRDLAYNYSTALVSSTITTPCPAPTGQATSLSLSSLTANSLTINSYTPANGANGYVIYITDDNTTHPIPDPTDGVTPSSATYYQGGAQCVYVGTETSPTDLIVTNLKQSTTYYVKVYAYQDCGGSSKKYEHTGLTGNVTTLCGAPSGTVGYFYTSTLGASSLSIDSYTGVSDAVGYVIYITDDNTNNPITVPADGTTPTANTVYGGSGAQCVYVGTETSPNVTVTGLARNKEYFMRVYAYNNCSGTKTYEQTGTGTYNTTSCPAPTEAATSLSLGIPTATTFPINSYTAPANGADGYVIYVNSSNSFTAPNDGTTPTANTSYSSGQQCVYVGTSTSPNVTVTNLQQYTMYYVKIYAYYDCSGTKRYEGDGLGGSVRTLCPAPTEAATSLSLGTPNTNSFSINSYTAPTNGATGYVIYVNDGSTFTGPTNGITPTANTVYGGSGEQCVYVGTATSPTDLIVTNLLQNTTYYVKVYAYNYCSGSTVTYETTGLGGSATTDCGAPTEAPTSLLLGNATVVQFSINGYTAPSNGADGYVIFVNTTNSFTVTTDGTTPTANTSYADGEQCVYVGTSVTPSVTVTNLNHNTRYHVRVYAYRDCSGTKKYETVGGYAFIDTQNASITWANLQSPSSITMAYGDAATDVFAQLRVNGVTPGAGQGAGIRVWIGVSSSNTDPTTWDESAWTEATYYQDADGDENTVNGLENDEYKAAIGDGLDIGTYYYASRFSRNNGTYYYGGTYYNFWNNDSGTLTVGKATLTVAANNKTVTYGDAAPSYTYNITGYKNGENASVITGSVSLSSTYTNTTPVSSSPVTITTDVSGMSADNYTFAPVNGTVTINKANQTIAFNDDLSGKTYGDADFTIGGTTSSGLTIGYTSSDANVATVSGNTVTIVGAGICTIHANQAGNDNYNAATEVDQTLTVSKANQTIAFNDDLSGKTYGDADFTLGGTTSSGLTIGYTSSDANVATVSGNTVTIVGAGSCTIHANQAGDDNYNAAAEVDQTLTVAKANQTITFNDDLSDKKYDDADFTLGATASSGLPISYTNNDAIVATISGNTVNILSTGSCIVYAKQAGNDNYNAATQVTKTLTVSKADQTITFNDDLSGKTYGDLPFDLTGTTNSDLEISYTSSDENVATVSGNRVTIVGAGSCTIHANQAGNANYNAAAQVDQTLTVAKANQTITFTDDLSGKTTGDGSFELGATASSGLTVSYTSSDANVATVSGNTLTIVGVGSCTIYADQAGNGNYNAATQESQTLTVACGAPAQAASSISFGTANAISFSINGYTAPTNGADGYVIFITDNDSFTAPTDGTTPTANTSYGGGLQCVYVGTSVTPNVTVTNLNQDSRYHVKVYAYNDCSGIKKYETTGVAGFIDTEAASIQMAGLNAPSSITMAYGDAATDMFAQIRVNGVTPDIGQGAGIRVWIGVNSTNTDPATWDESAWTVATYYQDADGDENTDNGLENDEYKVTIGDGLDVGMYYYASRFSRNGGGYYYGGSNNNFWGNSSVILTVDKATPTITTLPTASAITYGQTLESSTLSGGSASVTGSFAFTTPSTAPNAGTESQSITFTPDDSDRYNTAEGSVSVIVNKVALQVIAYNQSKTYGNSFTFAGTEFTTDGLLPGDDVTSVTLTSDGAAANASIGAYDIVPSNAQGYGLSNYDITYTNGTLNVYVGFTGDGTSASPYQITTPQELDAVHSDLTAYYILMNDIDLATYIATGAGNHGGAFWLPIGDETNLSGSAFRGNFDGNGKKITNLKINRPATNSVGLFGYAEDAVIYDLGVEVDAASQVIGSHNIGALIGNAVNCTVSNSYAIGTTSGNGVVGVLVGGKDGGDLHNCYASGQASATNNDVGGLLGGHFSGTISDCYATAQVSGTSNVGGLAGQNDGTITNCYSTGAVSGSSYVGGFVGVNEVGYVANSFWDTETSGQANGIRGTGKTTAQMKMQSTFTAASWDFCGESTNGTNNYWGINGSKNNGYPYLSWELTTTWNGSAWSNGTPNANYNVTISGLYNDAAFNANNLTVVPEGQLTIASGTATVSGNLVIQSDANGTGSFINNGTLNVTGTTTVQRYLADVGRYYYISSPVANMDAAAITGINDKLYEASTGHWTQLTSGNLNVMQGYAWKTGTTSATLEFTGGELNDGVQSITLRANDYTLVGNPYPSAINWGENDATGWNGSFNINGNDIHPTIWYRVGGTGGQSGGGNFVVYNRLVGNAQGETKNIIPAMQAFWVETGINGGILGVDNAARLHDAQPFYKSVNPTKGIYLTLNNGDQALVAFNPNADSRYSSTKMFADGLSQIYTVNSGKKLAINTFKGDGNLTCFENLTGLAVPVGIVAAQSGAQNIAMKNFNDFDANVSVYLEDKLTGAMHNLRSGVYSFDATEGTINDRFVLHLTQGATSVTNANTGDVSVYAYGKMAYVSLSGNLTASSEVAVFDVSGRLVANKNLSGFQNLTGLHIAQTGVYVVKVSTANGVTTHRIVIE